MRLSEKEFQILCSKCPALASKSKAGASTQMPKYRNQKVFIYANGVVSYGTKLPGSVKPMDSFDSTKEYGRWNELLLLERAGKISGLKRQEKILIQEKVIRNGVTIKEIAYKADFVYNEGDFYVVEDVKPVDAKTGRPRLTKDFALKWKLLQAKYPSYTFRIY